MDQIVRTSGHFKIFIHVYVTYVTFFLEIIYLQNSLFLIHKTFRKECILVSREGLIMFKSHIQRFPDSDQAFGDGKCLSQAGIEPAANFWSILIKIHQKKLSKQLHKNRIQSIVFNILIEVCQYNIILQVYCIDCDLPCFYAQRPASGHKFIIYSGPRFILETSSPILMNFI